MQYYSTNRQVAPVSFKEAVIKGLPDDNGLFMPESIPQLPKSFFDSLSSLKLDEIGLEVATPLIEEDIPRQDLATIISETLNFDIPVKPVKDNIYALELFHGPTLAFKDVGARFLARCLSYFSKESDEKVTVIVATSGDTGSAVAHGFLGVENVDVVILYPKGKVSYLQEKQLTTLGQNITALEVEGNFDDCQRLVKTAFLDKELNKKMKLTSANSINIARLIPQSFYYFWAKAQLPEKDLVFSVPSGNYGNLTAGLLAKNMGLDIKGFVASSNINDIVPNYLASGNYEPTASKATISNAMDVGNPSNFYRLQELYGKSWDKITAEIKGYSFTDEETKKAMKEVFDETGYVMDPHGAVGYLGLKNYLLQNEKATGLFLETAHPAKFKDTVEEVIGAVTIPERLAKYADKEKKSRQITSDFEEFKNYLKTR
ncbi:threonine synthase [Fulvivirga sediminis]|uniref:Threonine synthase n=1 Tax=Fulvivirga sediminis TaxID=2803949 RepID=A0A937F5L8_9BACT|nr:threonine synthase [Fulvivirga sediminis]MBL3654750.1 threonine synthase [Fulvivirga sediminis]